MKKLSLVLFLTGISYTVFSQQTNYSLPAEFSDLAVRAFQNANPALRQWFADAARQHPEGRFDSAWTMKKLKEQFDVQNLTSCASLFMVMLEYQRMQHKEARENRNISAAEKRQQLAEKEEKLKTDNKKIDQQMEEAGQKADEQMTAAQTDFWLAVVNTVSANAGSAAITEKKDTSRLRLPNNNNRLTKPAGRTTGTDNTGNTITRDRRNKLNDAITKLNVQIGEISRVSGLK